MKPLNIITPSTLQEALQIKDDNSTFVLMAGGTDFIINHRNDRLNYSDVLNISQIESLRGIEETLQEIIIGPLTTFSDIIKSKTVNEHFSLLVDAISHLGSPQIRNRGTIGGNICNASPAADSLGPLYVRDVTVILRSLHGTRTLPIHKFCIGPGKIDIEPNEILVQIRIPKKTGYAACYETLRQRKALACNKVSITVEGRREGEMVKEIAIALGAVAPTVLRVNSAEELLKMEPFSTETLRKAAILAKEEAVPINDVRSNMEYRKAMVEILTIRALKNIFEI